MKNRTISCSNYIPPANHSPSGLYDIECHATFEIGSLNLCVGSSSVSSIECETELISEAVTPFWSGFEFRRMAYSMGGEVDDDEMPFLAEDNGGEG